MVQLENEFGASLNKNKNNIDYLRYLHNLTLEFGFVQQLFTSDNIVVSKNSPINGIFTDVLETANFGQGEISDNLDEELKNMSISQPNKPLYVSEYWTGWFDAWSYKNVSNQHQKTSAKGLMKVAEKIMIQHNGSLNFYPFIGGTSFGFFNGFAYSDNQISDFYWVTTSYDYDAPINEAHQYTEKYSLIREFYSKLVQLGRLPKLHLPQIPKAPTLFAYGKMSMNKFRSFEEILEVATKFTLSKAVSMEMLQLGPGYGQRYGFVNYRIKTKNQVSNYEVKGIINLNSINYLINKNAYHLGPIKDRGILLVDGSEEAVVFNEKNCSIDISSSRWSNTTSHTLDMLVENMGRENHFYSYPKTDLKGIDSKILLNGVESTQLEVYSLDFSETYMDKLEQMSHFDLIPEEENLTGPAMYRGELQVSDTPKDTYLLMDGWTKGIVLVNDFNIGRYWNVGPQKALYVPGVLLNTGLNVIKVFELHKAGMQLQFVDRQIWKN